METNKLVRKRRRGSAFMADLLEDLTFPVTVSKLHTDDWESVCTTEKDWVIDSLDGLNSDAGPRWWCLSPHVRPSHSTSRIEV